MSKVVAVLSIGFVTTASPALAQDGVDLSEAELPAELDWIATKQRTLVPPPPGLPPIEDGTVIDGVLPVTSDCSGSDCTYTSALNLWPQSPYVEVPAVPWERGAGNRWTLPLTGHHLSAGYGGGADCVYLRTESWDVTVIEAVHDGEKLVATRLEGTFERTDGLDPAMSTVAMAEELCPPYETADVWSVVATADGTPPPIPADEPGSTPEIEPATGSGDSPTEIEPATGSGDGPTEIEPATGSGDGPIAAEAASEGGNSAQLILLALAVVAAGGAAVLIATKDKRTKPPLYGEELRKGAYCDWTIEYADGESRTSLREPRGTTCCRYTISVETIQVVHSLDQHRERYFGPAPIRHFDEPYWLYSGWGVGRHWVNEVEGVARLDMDGLNMRANAIARENEGVPVGDVELPLDGYGFPRQLLGSEVDALGTKLGLDHVDENARTAGDAEAHAEVRFADATQVTITRTTPCHPNNQSIILRGSGRLVREVDHACTDHPAGGTCSTGFDSRVGAKSWVSGSLAYSLSHADESETSVTSTEGAVEFDLGLEVDTSISALGDRLKIDPSLTVTPATGHEDGTREVLGAEPPRAQNASPSEPIQSFSIVRELALRTSVSPARRRPWAQTFVDIAHDIEVFGGDAIDGPPPGPHAREVCRDLGCGHSTCHCDPDFELHFGAGDGGRVVVTVADREFELSRPVLTDGVAAAWVLTEVGAQSDGPDGATDDETDTTARGSDRHTPENALR